jgi:hypothetical protein
MLEPSSFIPKVKCSEPADAEDKERVSAAFAILNHKWENRKLSKVLSCPGQSVAEKHLYFLSNAVSDAVHSVWGADESFRGRKIDVIYLSPAQHNGNLLSVLGYEGSFHGIADGRGSDVVSATQEHFNTDRPCTHREECTGYVHTWKSHPGFTEADGPSVSAQTEDTDDTMASRND